MPFDFPSKYPVAQKIRQMLFIIVLSIHPYSSLLGQDTKTIVHRYEGSKQIREQYQVLTKAKTIKNGEYISYFKVSDAEWDLIKRGQLSIEAYIKEKGTYKLGKKDGPHVEYSSPKVLKSSGQYRNGQKTGLWHFAKEDGQVIERYDFDLKTPLPPMFEIKIAYPERARKTGIEGSVALSYKISRDCSISNIIVTKSLDVACDQEAIRVISKLSELQKKYKAMCTDSLIIQEIIFKLE